MTSFSVTLQACAPQSRQAIPPLPHALRVAKVLHCTPREIVFTGGGSESDNLAIKGAALAQRGFKPITTEIIPAPPFYFAEGYHQQYLAKVPSGYCGLGGTGVSCPLPTGVTA